VSIVNFVRTNILISLFSEYAQESTLQEIRWYGCPIDDSELLRNKFYLSEHWYYESHLGIQFLEIKGPVNWTGKSLRSFRFCSGPFFFLFHI
jgi:hypothetical protein